MTTATHRSYGHKPTINGVKNGKEHWAILGLAGGLGGSSRHLVERRRPQGNRNKIGGCAILCRAYTVRRQRVSGARALSGYRCESMFGAKWPDAMVSRVALR